MSPSGHFKPYHLLAAILALAAGVAPIHAQDGRCQLQLESDTESSVPYMERNGRCEGLYVEPKSADDPLEIIGYHQHEPDFDPGNSDPIHVTAYTGSRDAEAVIAVTRNPRHYYQMDKAPLPAGDRFQWPTDIIFQPEIALTPDKLAVLACVQACDESQLDPPLLAPVSVSQADAVQDPSPRILIRPAVNLEKLYVSMKGPDGTLLLDEQPMERGFYPAGQSFPLLLNPRQGVPVRKTGLHELRLRGLGEDGMTVSTTRRIFVAEIP